MTRTVALALAVPGALGLQLLAPAPAAADPKGASVGSKVDKAWGGYKSEETDLELELIDAGGQKVTRKMRGKAREVSNEEQSVITIVWPADLKGTRLLTWNHRGKDNDQWLYLPSIKRVKRISARGQSGSFMGSEFSYEDLVNFWWVEKYDYKFVKDQKVGARDTWLVERTPKSKDSGYSKQIMWIDKEYLGALRCDFYDRKGKLLKTAMWKSWKKYGTKWRADRVEMSNKQTGKSSNAVWKSRAWGKGFTDDEFNPTVLGTIP